MFVASHAVTKSEEEIMLNIVITIIGIIAIVLLWIMLYDSNRFVVVGHTFTDKRIRRTYRAIVLADLHNKKYGKNNERLLQAIREQKPDAIFIAGDMLTAKPGETLDAALSFLGELAKDYPVYYGNGNHEHRLKLYPQKYDSMAKDYEKGLRKIGISRLVNDHVELPEAGITIYGAEIDRFYYTRFRTQFMPEEYLPGILGEPETGKYCVLLAHNPDYFPAYARWGADLVLSGHVHGGMVRIPFWRGVVSPAVRLFPKYDGGLFREGKSTMLLSRGLGMHTIPIRLFNPGEVLVVDLKPLQEG